MREAFGKQVLAGFKEGWRETSMVGTGWQGQRGETLVPSA